MLKKPKKYLLLIIFILVAIILVTQLWQQPILLSIALVITAIIKHNFVSLRRELLTFIIFGLLGSATESLMILGGPWQYAAPQLINFPIWLPLLWGLAGTIGISLYLSLFATIKS